MQQSSKTDRHGRNDINQEIIVCRLFQHLIFRMEIKMTVRKNLFVIRQFPDSIFCVDRNIGQRFQIQIRYQIGSLEMCLFVRHIIRQHKKGKCDSDRNHNQCKDKIQPILKSPVHLDQINQPDASCNISDHPVKNIERTVIPPFGRKP